MKAVVLGGAGDMGRTAVRTAAGLRLLDELVVADRDEAGAVALADEIRGSGAPTPVRAARVDVTDATGLRALLAPFDVALNTTGPFYRFGVPVLEAAIDAGCHYLDICDDWEPTLEMLGRDGRARQAGVTAVVGLGASPGASNLLAALVRRELDEVQDLYTAWPLDVGDEGVTTSVESAPADGRPSAAIVHWMHQISGTVRVVRDGRFVDEAPLRPVELDFPGVGSGTAYSVGHPEPVTLGRAGAVRGDGCNLMVGSPGLIGFLRELQAGIDGGKLDVEEAAAIVSRAMADPGATAEVGPAPADLAGPGALPPFFAWGRGVHAGRPRTVGARVLGMPAGMAAATSVPLVLGLRQLALGRIAEPGVHAPEDVLDPDAFFEDLAPYCTPPARSRDEVVAVTHGRAA